MDLGLLQKEVGSIIGVDGTTIYNWENNHTSPSLHAFPKLIRFLGYNPLSSIPTTLGERLLAYRKLNGITQEELARRLGVRSIDIGQVGEGEKQADGELIRENKTID